ncbi:hypothetical protein ACI5DH_000082 [Cronobacter turicensis]
MSEISKEALAAACAEKVKHLEFAVAQSAFGEVRRELETELAIARVALAALRERAEPVPVVPKIDRKAICNKVHWLCARSPGATFYNAAEFALDEVAELLAPPAPVVPTFEEWCQRNGQKPVGWVREAMKEAYEACRAAYFNL